MLHGKARFLQIVPIVIHLFFVGIRRFHVRQSQQIIHADMMKLRQRNQHLGRNHPFSPLIIGIGSLWNIDLPAQLCLGQIGIFS